MIPALDYPFGQLPSPGSALPVAPGVLWIRMPLPFALDHINLWLIEDGEGYAVVDTGLRTPETTAAWSQLAAGVLDGRPVTRVFATHMHPDHCGMVGWLSRRYDCRLWMTRLEYLTCRLMAADTGRQVPEEGLQFYRRAGWDAAALDHYATRFGNFGKGLFPLPDSYRRMVDGEHIRIGAHEWRVVTGNGHSPEHACLHCAELGLFISGDQVLPRISSNVSVHPTEPDADPLTDWLASLAKLGREIPPEVLVLPSHNEPFRGLDCRLDELAAGQSDALDRLRIRLQQPCRAVDVFDVLFRRKVAGNLSLIGFATGEALACLNHLLLGGELEVEDDDAGVRWYRNRAA